MNLDIFYFVIYVLFYIQKHLYSSFTERISNMKPLSSFKPQAVFSDIDGTFTNLRTCGISAD